MRWTGRPDVSWMYSQNVFWWAASMEGRWVVLAHVLPIYSLGQGAVVAIDVQLEAPKEEVECHNVTKKHCWKHWRLWLLLETQYDSGHIFAWSSKPLIVLGVYLLIWAEIFFIGEESHHIWLQCFNLLINFIAYFSFSFFFFCFHHCWQMSTSSSFMKL